MSGSDFTITLCAFREGSAAEQEAQRQAKQQAEFERAAGRRR